MALLDKLLGYIHRVFDKDPRSILALRIRHNSAAFNWSVADGVLSGFDGAAPLFTVNLEGYTLASLINHLATLNGIVVSNAADPALLLASASTLVSGSGVQAVSNGDALFAYSSLLWMYMDVMAGELAAAKASIVTALDQMTIQTADADWLDEWGGYFAVPRLSGELDAAYANRIIVEVMRPRGNNKAIEQALFEAFGQDAQVLDLIKYNSASHNYSGSVNHNAAWFHNGTSDAVYGLFQVVLGYDVLAGGDQAAFAAAARALIEKFRDAGTQMDSLQLTGSVISDSEGTSPVDASASLTVTTLAYYNGVFAYGGAATYIGTAVTVESPS